MECSWCKCAIEPDEKYVRLKLGCERLRIKSDLPVKAIFHRHCLIQYEREILWDLKLGGHDVSESAKEIRETPTSPYGA